MNTRKILIIIASTIILLLFGLISSISYNTGMNYGVTNAETIRTKRAKVAETHTKQIKTVLVTKVKNTTIKNQINSAGRVVSLNNITISSEVQGRLAGNNTFKKGSEVMEGEVIFSVRDTDLRLLIKAKKSQFMSLISANIPDIRVDFGNEYIKWNDFFNTIDLEENLPDFPQMNTAKEKNYIISRSILAEYLSIRSDEEKLGKYTVLAPFDGIITKSYSDVGGNVNPGSPVVDFIRKGNMEIELTVNTSEIQFINIGDIVSFTDNGKKYSGKVIRKGRFVNTNTQNISVFTSINDNEGSLYNGMYLNATITTKGTENTFKLPRRSIFENNKVFIVDTEKRLKIKNVNIIAYQGDEVIIDNMLENTLIVNEPLVYATEGTIVKAILK
jgi:membrane fusion protein, multidrug efflux system